ncbi:MAG: hypothetical protein AB1631_31275 [Acidobacteriota bacterium]
MQNDENLPDIDTSQLFINDASDWECRGCGESALLWQAIPHPSDCPALIYERKGNAHA